MDILDKLKDAVTRDEWLAAGDEAIHEIERLRERLNSPEIKDFVDAVMRETAHQRERWGTDHDAGKTPDEWLWLIAYLATKATQAQRYGDHDKYLHHIITCAAACANWHAYATGVNTEMRPGVQPKGD